MVGIVGMGGVFAGSPPLATVGGTPAGAEGVVVGMPGTAIAGAVGTPGTAPGRGGNKPPGNAGVTVGSGMLLLCPGSGGMLAMGGVAGMGVRVAAGCCLVCVGWAEARCTMAQVDPGRVISNTPAMSLITIIRRGE